MQGYNAQAVCNEQQIVIAAEVNADSPDFGHLQPMITATQRELRDTGISAPLEIVVADAGYWHHVCRNVRQGALLPRSGRGLD